MYFHALIFQTRSGLGPHITGSDESVNTTTKAATRFTKNEACYSRSGDKSCVLICLIIKLFLFVFAVALIKRHLCS